MAIDILSGGREK